ncbi:hypothetical protein [Streptacidiphilus sp. EB129]|uniref:hypothetical protein n=1 Tax=Streptacidiphilus sp. EB129 TaxID=3156262 RepID=UPI003512926A
MTVLAVPEMIRIGDAWHIVAIPATRGRPLFDTLAAEGRHRLGPVAYSASSGQTYWLIRAGRQYYTWPRGCRLLTAGVWVTLPALGVSTRLATWLQPPTADLYDTDLHLTGATWLAAALDINPGEPS